MDILKRLDEVLESRKSDEPATSYVARLYHSGLDGMVDKVMEEAAEVAAAAKAGDREQLIYETADLWFHSLVMLSFAGLSSDQVLQELEDRFGTSGLRGHGGRHT